MAISAFVVTLLLLIWIVVFFFWSHRLMHDHFVAKRKSWLFLGYEVPNPHRWLFIRYLMWGIIPAFVFLLSENWILGTTMFVATGWFFHRRNKRVMQENQDGINDPIWGPHIRRNREADKERRVREMVVRLVNALRRPK